MKVEALRLKHGSRGPQHNRLRLFVVSNTLKFHEVNELNHLRILAGGFAGAGALLLLWQGHTAEGAILLATLMAFFVGEKNGQKTAA